MSLKQFVYEYNRHGDIVKEYYLAKDEKDVYYYCFRFMDLDRVNKHFFQDSKGKHRHCQFSFEEQKEYLHSAGEARVYEYKPPDFTNVYTTSHAKSNGYYSD